MLYLYHTAAAPSHRDDDTTQPHASTTTGPSLSSIYAPTVVPVRSLKPENNIFPESPLVSPHLLPLTSHQLCITQSIDFQICYFDVSTSPTNLYDSVLDGHDTGPASGICKPHTRVRQQFEYRRYMLYLYHTVAALSHSDDDITQPHASTTTTGPSLSLLYLPTDYRACA